MESGCSKCGRPAVYLRRYTGECLCASCLVDTTVDRVRRNINRLKMLREDDCIAVAISGGKDSAVLLSALHTIEDRYPDSQLVPVTIDEGIRGYRDRALPSARRLAESLGLKLAVFSFREFFGHTLDEIVRMRTSSALGACSYCGVLRRRALNLAAQAVEADVVATGHNMDDEAQTIMMNIMRGDSRRIARTNVPRERAIEGFVPRVKPITDISERDIVAYSHVLNLPYHDVPCPYADEAYRNELRTFLNDMEHKRPGTLLAILRSNEAISDAFYKVSGRREASKCGMCGAPCSSRICKACEILAQLRG